MSGSIAMSSMAALKSGSGLVSAAIPDRCLETVASFHPAIMTIPIRDDDLGRFALHATTDVVARIESADAIGIGPGMTTGPGSIQIVERVLSGRPKPMVLDADGLNCLADLGFLEIKSCNLESVVLTPHPGELERLTGVSAKNRQAQIEAAIRLAGRTGATIVVKGGPTVVVNCDQTYTNETGNPGMATGGTGDVLTGVITSLLGQGLPLWEASCLGVWIHGRAGDIAANKHGLISMTAMEVLDALADTFREINPR
jgi:NAD(P)H-hydrate epimerase